jgi:hypothetical protein
MFIPLLEPPAAAPASPSHNLPSREEQALEEALFGPSSAAEESLVFARSIHMG